MAAEQFIDFVNSSPSPYHAVATSIKMLEKEGFVRLREDESWGNLKTDQQKYYVTRNGTSLIAFALPEARDELSDFQIIGAHTDSPCFRVKPISNSGKVGYLQVGVETYGGGLWYTWFDRDLTVAGRVVLQGIDPNSKDAITTKLVHLSKPILRIPSLAIHLNRDANSKFSPNTESQTAPIIATEIKANFGKLSSQNEGEKKKHHPVLVNVLAEELQCDADCIVDFDLYVADSQPSRIVGALNEFVSSPRLDNQASCFAALEALEALVTAEERKEMTNRGTSCRIVCMFDHEEIGSRSAQGAFSTFLNDIIGRIHAGIAKTSELKAILAASFIISSDMAHAIHPNYTSKHEENHRPALHNGVVIKTNQNQRYATSGYSGFILREIARQSSIPIQEFVVPNDLPCGSTIGPIIAAETGIRTVDVGMPQLAMHSCREICGADDFDHAINLFKHFFLHFRKIDDEIRDQFH
uniref:aspartyl aminopeptidase n=1 Tax=Rhodosorus marinus TaxID=101924 RepID=A0A7S3A1C9_9RHOD|mmetsp:Transcript_41080/g.162376  ORF Transcript_41080/g.162376 Transcript_41080/m.162376 type:complete len:468 (+) Transcript_41080:1309-2712(+)|eukprot:CAMPEP_0113962844 /NCGR_PEP_ID=MMETSP0011_2-20120614/6171_1 /TAXON_ID=101924 /ORGANISM="Rhodosorus marinus" /LENGTH=467 /DNA_ID=CAMNT_0000974803 /DNA_START=1184 /DNA_END=2587 /DNA_ORIENTATION=+ /assembly_acc=CAM_ASM_000156